jgi:tetratricopeptide (TPR) repeat protein
VPELSEKRDEVKRLHKANRHAEALPIARMLWQETEPKDKWDGFYFATCLRKTGQSETALEVCGAVRLLDPAFVQINNLQGWCEYDLHIKPSLKEDEVPDESGDANANVENAVLAANRVIALTKQEKFSPYTRVVLGVSKLLLSSGGQERARQSLSFLDRLTPELLETPTSFVKPKEVGFRATETKDYALEHEDYSLRRCKALLLACEFTKCIDFAKSQLTSFPSKIGRYDVWLAYYKAKALASSGHHEEACVEGRQLVSIKPEWYIEHLIAENEFRQNNMEAAWASCLRAATMTGKLASKVNLVTLMARVLEAKGNNEEARRHLLLHVALEAELGGTIREETRALAVKLGLQSADRKIPAENSSYYLKALQPFWREEMGRNIPRLPGRIKSLLGETAGFVRSADGQDFYFKVRDFLAPRGALTLGSQVTFTVVDSFDPVKGKASQRAEQIRLAE